MKTRAILFFVFCALSSAALFSPRIAAAGWQFSRTLSFGARGPDVFALQKILNQNGATRVAVSGAGSLGAETSFFGPATARAVRSFQRLHEAEVDFSLESGTVGPATRALLNQQMNKSSGAAAQKSTVAVSPSSAAPPARAPAPIADAPAENPNARNLDGFLATVKQVGGAQGYASEKLATIADEVRAYALGTTTDFFKKFVSETQQSVRTVSYLSPFLNRVAEALGKVSAFFAPRADAQAPSFGGLVLYVFPCTCSGNWLINMVPLSAPPIVLITHYSGSQAYANYNAPFTLLLLGNYIPQGAPCLFYVGLACTTLPSQAQTTFVLGSS